MSDKDTLISFGFDEAKANRALRATKNSGLEAALEWLEKHQDDPEQPEDDEDEEAAEAKLQDQGEAKSLKCLDCGKIFRNTALASYHGEKSGHANFEESTEEIKPLTEEEKRDRLAELRARADAKRAVKAKEDAEAAKREEAIRRKGGKEMGTIREEMRLKEAEKEAAQRKADKLADQAARARVKQQIEADKRARAEKAAAEKAKREGLPTPAASAAAGPSTAQLAAKAGPSASSSNYAQTRLQFRLSSGNPIVSTFESDQSLADVVDWLVQQPQAVDAGVQKGLVKFSTTFPRKQFTPDQMTQSLRALGLAPASVLVVS